VGLRDALDSCGRRSVGDDLIHRALAVEIEVAWRHVKVVDFLVHLEFERIAMVLLADHIVSHQQTPTGGGGGGGGGGRGWWGGWGGGGGGGGVGGARLVVRGCEGF